MNENVNENVNGNEIENVSDNDNEPSAQASPSLLAFARALSQDKSYNVLKFGCLQPTGNCLKY